MTHIAIVYLLMQSVPASPPAQTAAVLTLDRAIAEGLAKYLVEADGGKMIRRERGRRRAHRSPRSISQAKQIYRRPRKNVQ